MVALRGIHGQYCRDDKPRKTPPIRGCVLFSYRLAWHSDSARNHHWYCRTVRCTSIRGSEADHTSSTFTVINVKGGRSFINCYNDAPTMKEKGKRPFRWRGIVSWMVDDVNSPHFLFFCVVDVGVLNSRNYSSIGHFALMKVENRRPRLMFAY